MAECRAGNRRVPDPGKAGTRPGQSEELNGRAVRRGTAMLLLTAGDREISKALADGIMAVRLPMAKPLGHEEAGVVKSAMKWLSLQEQREAQDADETRGQGSGANCAGRGANTEIDRQMIADELREKLHPVPVDYAGLAYTAEVRYGESLYEPGVIGKIGEALLVGYAMVVMAFRELFEAVGT